MHNVLFVGLQLDLVDLAFAYETEQPAARDETVTPVCDVEACVQLRLDG
jgi:hypothetical protein